ncbi:minor capsid protein [Companilactobacillus furfuricola]|uniref:minor capsid protein n=1 Tax=Companilactobacillus furfuricola TaxID=1462575 RepID=UPI000F7A21A1|nr:minor capsid protein [Companilactobacillus furfuricola]
MGYWEKREREWIDQQQKQDIDFDKQIDGIYNKSLDKIDKDISQFYTRYANKEGISIDEAKKRVSNFDVKGFQDTAKKMVEEQDFSDEANERLRIYNATMRINRLEMLKSQIGVDLLAETDEIGDKLSERLVKEISSERVRQAGILGDTVPKMTERRMEALIYSSYHGAKFSDRIWTNQDVLKNELDNIITRSLVMGMNADQLSSRLRSLIDDKIKNAGYAASRIARTESARVADQYSRILYMENDFDKVKWIAEPTACSVCKPLDNKVFELMGDGDNPAPDIPVHPNCRCSTVTVDDDWNEPPTPKERELKQQKESKNNKMSEQGFHSDDMEKIVGKDISTGFDKIVNSKEFDPRLKQVFNRYQDQFSFKPNRSRKKPAYYAPSDKSVHMLKSRWKENEGNFAYQTGFHEMGHAIDNYSIKEFYENGRGTTGLVKRTKLYNKQILETPITTVQTSSSDKFNFRKVIKEDMDNAIFGGSSDGMSYDQRRIAKQGFLNMVREEMDQLPEDTKYKVYSSFSDMLESTGYFGAYPLRYGHGSKYWKHNGMAETEFIAHMTESAAVNPLSLKVLQKYMPKSVDEYWKMIEEINKR